MTMMWRNLKEMGGAFLFIALVLGTIDVALQVAQRFFSGHDFAIAYLVPLAVWLFLSLMLALFWSFLQRVGLISRERSTLPFCVFCGLALIAAPLVAFFLDEPYQTALFLSLSLTVFVEIFSWLVFRRSAFAGIASVWQRLQRSAAYRNMAFFLCVGIFVAMLADLFALYSPSYPGKGSGEHTKNGMPNIILIVLDTVRADHLSLYGYPRETTPFLEELGEKSLVFNAAVSPCSWTLPSHASMFTGKWVSQHGAHLAHQQLAAQEITLAELLAAEGYSTIGFVGGPYCQQEYGIAQGFQFYDDRVDFFEINPKAKDYNTRAFLQMFDPWLPRYVLGSDDEKRVDEIQASLEPWLSAGPQEPFFLFVNIFDAHSPHDIADYRDLFTTEDRDDLAIELYLRGIHHDPKLGYAPKKASPGFINYLKASYDAEIRFVDEALRRLFSRLSSSQLLENSLIIITSDHGEEFFEHGGVRHSKTLYEEVIHVPLLVYSPGIVEPGRVSTPVSTVQIFHTVLSFVAEQSQGQVEFPKAKRALSLLSFPEEGKQAPVVAELFGRKELGEIALKAVRQGPHKLIEVEQPMGRIPNALFHLGRDPKEQNNLYHQEKEQREELQTLLKAEMK